MLIEALAFVSPRMTVATIVPEVMLYAPFASAGRTLNHANSGARPIRSLLGDEEKSWNSVT